MSIEPAKLVTQNFVNAILKDALAATGQKPVTPYVGSHLLRHSLAVQLVNAARPASVTFDER